MAAGSNLLAAEVHQKNTTSSDFVFDLQLERRRTSVTLSPEPPSYQTMRNLLAWLRVTELMYDPVNGNNYEYLELRNISPAVTLDLTDVRFTKGISFVFPAMTLAPGAYVLVARNLPAFESVYGSGLNVAGTFTGKLANEGDQLVLQLPDPWLTAIRISTFRRELGRGSLQ